MRGIQKFVAGALLASAAIGGASVAHADNALSITGNVALTTDYIFRGVSQTQHEPAIQGGFDLTYGQFYAGTWASNVDFGHGAGGVHVPMELDLYGGFRPTIGPVSADFGVIAYTYPDSTKTGFGDWTYYELKALGTVPVTPALTLGASLFWSPEWAQKGGNGIYAELNGAYTFSPELSVSGAVGYVDANPSKNDYPNGYFLHRDGSSTNDYTTYNIGATYSTHGFAIDLRYYGNSEDDLVLFSNKKVTDDTVVLTLKRSL
jgi:uncharacterized protein (TIGR02001 family)